MTWTAYPVTFRLLSPMHVGWHKLGNLQQTRPYITGRSLWGAITARLTRELGSKDYEGVGKKVDNQLAYTYFYPFASTKPNEIDPAQLGTTNPFPWGDDWDKFAWMFLSSYASTALENARNAAAGSLHETEFIAPYVRKRIPDEEPTAVYLVGYIFQNEEYTIGYDWKEVLDKLQIGGERSYGWGRVRLEGVCKPIKDLQCFGYKLICTGHRPQITVPKDKTVLAHTYTENLDSVKAGTMEPLVGRETNSDTGFGKKPSLTGICWIPGSKVSKDETFQIEAKGIWKRI